MTTVGEIAQAWTPERLKQLRRELVRQNLDAFIIPRWDRHQGEYCAAHDERLAWATGFSGSWGLAVVTLETALLFVDGRYTVQAGNEVDPAYFAVRHLHDEPVHSWIGSEGVKNQVVGYDPSIVSPALYDDLSGAAAQIGIHLRATECNPVDAAWLDQPSPPQKQFEVHDSALTGEDVKSKRRRLSAALRQDGVDLLVETQTDNVAWLLSIRGSDVPYTPVTLASMLVEAGGQVHLFIDPAKIPELWLEEHAFDVVPHAPARFLEVLERLVRPGLRVSIDPHFAPVGAVEATKKGEGVPVLQPDPLTRLKAVKNPAELRGLREASKRDSVAWCRFLAWLPREVLQREAAGDPIDELEAEEKMLAFRRETDGFVSPSFRTISASDANGAMCHYAAPAKKSAKILSTSIYLLDSGGQYPDGTTDTTRTLCFSEPTEEVRRNFTLVLKGHIKIASMLFSVGTRGHQIDAFAREALWRHKLDYDHGTGHGVGHFLSVHERPQRLSKEAAVAALDRGMTITNEPGYYRAGHYGIRIENLCEIVEESPGWLRLRDLTLVPIQRDLIDIELLDDHEREWLDAYHIRVWQEIVPHLVEDSERNWLAEQTAPVAG